MIIYQPEPLQYQHFSLSCVTNVYAITVVLTVCIVAELRKIPYMRVALQSTTIPLFPSFSYKTVLLNPKINVSVVSLVTNHWYYRVFSTLLRYFLLSPLVTSCHKTRKPLVLLIVTSKSLVTIETIETIET